MQSISTQSQVPGQSSGQSKPYSLEDWRGGNRSLQQEFDYEIDQVEGQVPADLNGILFRNGPGLLDVFGRPVHHPFDGDGMVCAITFSGGRAHFRNRFVQTEGYCAEQKAGRMLYRGVFGTKKPGGWLANAFDLRRKNVSNTNVIFWGDKLMTLWEASHPYRLDPHSLETLGMETLNGVLHKDSPFAAHPMIDPGNGEREPRLVTFGIDPGPVTTIHLYELNAAGVVVLQHDHKVPGFAFVHDFAITPNYCLFFQNPVTFNPLPYVLGWRGAAECISFHGDRPTKIRVIPRNPTQPMQEIDADPCFVFHHANAFEQGNEIIVDSVCYETFPGMDHDLNYQQIDFDQRPPAQLWRFTLDLENNTSSRRLVQQRACEFPFVNPTLIGKRHRFVFLAAAHQPQGDAPQQAIIKVDPEAGEQQFWSDAPKGFVGEPVFVPRPQAEQEDDGWVLTLVYNAAREKSDLVILDGKNLQPIARLHLKHHVPYGLHGSFSPGTPGRQESSGRQES